MLGGAFQFGGEVRNRSTLGWGTRDPRRVALNYKASARLKRVGATMPSPQNANAPCCWTKGKVTDQQSRHPGGVRPLASLPSSAGAGRERRAIPSARDER